MKPIKTETDSQGIVIKTFKGKVKVAKIKPNEYTLSVNGVYYPAIYKTEASAIFAADIKYEILRDLFKAFNRKFPFDLKFLKEVKRVSVIYPKNR